MTSASTHNASDKVDQFLKEPEQLPLYIGKVVVLCMQHDLVLTTNDNKQIERQGGLTSSTGAAPC